MQEALQRWPTYTHPYPYPYPLSLPPQVSLFALSRELLSPQQHYDWGLRALKTSLGIAGRELREVGSGASCARGVL